jgi:hypothetical protein
MPGRPKGSKNVAAEIVPAEPARCPKCRGTEYRRVPGRSPRVSPHGGLDREGRPYTHVVWRHVACVACGQRFVERTYENRPPTPTAAAGRASRN